jgi:phosphoglycolate phosphatase-like HAD superfamily hydrolase
MTTIFFDMDGTLADLYGVENWLAHLEAQSAYPYENARPLLNLQVLARRLNRLAKAGYAVEIISWTAKHSTPEYDKAVAAAKIEWLDKHLHSVKFQKINIVEYGTQKDLFRHSENDILFDDEIGNRENWNGIAYDVDKILEVLKNV